MKPPKRFAPALCWVAVHTREAPLGMVRVCYLRGFWETRCRNLHRFTDEIRPFHSKSPSLGAPIFSNGTVTTRTLLDWPEVARCLVSWGTFS